MLTTVAIVLCWVLPVPGTALKRNTEYPLMSPRSLCGGHSDQLHVKTQKVRPELLSDPPCAAVSTRQGGLSSWPLCYLLSGQRGCP